MSVSGPPGCPNCGAPCKPMGFCEKCGTNRSSGKAGSHAGGKFGQCVVCARRRRMERDAIVLTMAFATLDCTGRVGERYAAGSICCTTHKIVLAGHEDAPVTAEQARER